MVRKLIHLITKVLVPTPIFPFLLLYLSLSNLQHKAIKQHRYIYRERERELSEFLGVRIIVSNIKRKSPFWVLSSWSGTYTSRNERRGASRSGLSCLGIKDKAVRAIWSMTKQMHMLHVTHCLPPVHHTRQDTRYLTESKAVRLRVRLGKS